MLEKRKAKLEAFKKEESKWEKKGNNTTNRLNDGISSRADQEDNPSAQNLKTKWQKQWAATGIEPVTSCTRSKNHTSRPSGRDSLVRCRLMELWCVVRAGLQKVVRLYNDT